MTDQPNPEREIHLRVLVEAPSYPPIPGVEYAKTGQPVSEARAARVCRMVLEDRHSPIAATAVVRKAWNPTVDGTALMDAAQEDDRG